MCRLNRFGFALMFCAAFVMNVRSDDESKPTHKMGESLKVGSGCSSFCVDGDGNIWAACGKEVRVLSPEGKKLHTHELSFACEVINVSPKGEIFVAGNGRMAGLDKDGKEVNAQDTPPMSDKDAVKKAEEQQKKAMEQNIKNQKAALERIEGTIKTLEEVDEADRTDAQKRQINQIKQQITYYTRNIKTMEANLQKPINAGGIMVNAKKVTGLAVTEKEVFVACGSFGPGGYDVWRCDHKFGDPKQILTGLRGCCGQMDIQAKGDNVIVAENCKHCVTIYDREGKKVRSFGKADRTGNGEGFSSCCNPMNTSVNSSGEILTSESGNGTIKRFTEDGKYLGIVGSAKIAAGCKRVTIAANKDMSRVYFLDFQGGKIVVLESDKASAEKAEKTN